MNKELPKWVKVIAGLLIALLVGMVAVSYDRMHIYGIYIREKSPEITMRLTELHAGMNEAAVRKHFEGVPLDCIGQASGNDSLGDRVCYASLDKADGDAALTLAAFFSKGKLARIMVQTPWRVLGSWHQRLGTQFGQPQRAGMAGLTGGPVLRWILPNGYVESNRRRSFNPLNWNVILWTGKTQ